jgi:hypothetical protein
VLSRLVDSIIIFIDYFKAVHNHVIPTRVRRNNPFSDDVDACTSVLSR